MNKKVLFWHLVEWFGCFAVVYLIVGGSVWLNIALTHAAILSRRLIEQRQLFNIADAELVRVSAVVGRLEHELTDIRANLELTELKLTDLESANMR